MSVGYSGPLTVGERLTFNVSWSNVVTAARMELEVAGRGEKPGRVIVVFGTKGGVGRSTLAANLAVGLGQIYWKSVARPAQQIDRAVNPSQLPSIFGPGQLVGTPRPTFVFRDTDFWAQGISFGLELRY